MLLAFKFPRFAFCFSHVSTRVYPAATNLGFFTLSRPATSYQQSFRILSFLTGLVKVIQHKQRGNSRALKPGKYAVTDLQPVRKRNSGSNRVNARGSAQKIIYVIGKECQYMCLEHDEKLLLLNK